MSVGTWIVANKKTVLWFSGGISLFLIVLSFITSNSTRSGYLFGVVSTESITEVVSEPGAVLTSNTAVVYSPSNGFISSLYVSNDQTVKKGDTLFTVISSATEQEKKNAYAEYLKAKAALDADQAVKYSLQGTMFSSWKTFTDLSTNATYQNADGTPHTSHRLAAEFTSAQANWLAAEQAYKNQQSVIAKDQAVYAAAALAYKATQTATVTAPVDGIVTNLSISKGSSVITQTVLTPNPQPVLLLKSGATSEAVISISQTNITKVAVGQKVVIKPDAYKSKVFDGTISRLDSIGQNKDGVVTYYAYVQLTDTEDLRPGMTFDGDITTQSITDALAVPNSAVVYDKSVPTVRVLSQNKVVQIPIKVGIKGKTHTHVLEGLKKGQEIIVSLKNERAERPSFLGL